MSVFNNKQFLTNIWESKETLRAITNGGRGVRGRGGRGVSRSCQVGEFPNLGTVWYNHNSIANILSMKEVQKVCCVTMDTSIEPTLFVHHLDGSIMKFEEQESGLYIFKPNSNTSINIYPHCTLVTTIEENKRC